MGDLKISPKKDFDFNSLIKSSNDTLEIVTCSKDVIYPFGKFDTISELKSSLLKGFKIVSQKTDDSMYFVYNIVSGNNRLTLLLDKDPDASAHSNILNGLITDNSIKTINNIQIGMSADSFYKLYFKSYPSDLSQKFKIVIFDYCVNGIKHIYTFKDNKINRIEYK
jgi:hypothetical protein